jgi:hypothetical protein
MNDQQRQIATFIVMDLVFIEFADRLLAAVELNKNSSRLVQIL